MTGLTNPIWIPYRDEVPLTGREPLLHRVRASMRTVRAGPHCTVLHGPSGSGKTRLLRDIALGIRHAQSPVPLSVSPCPHAVDEYEPIRRMLRDVFKHRTRSELERALRAAVPEVDLEVTAMALWLMGGETGRRVMRPSIPRLRHLLARVAGGNPILVDDIDLLPEASRNLLVGIDPHGVGLRIVATATDRLAEVPGESVAIEPLTSAQTELMLKRWLRDPESARKLATVLSEMCHGRAGVIVETVRELGRMGNFARDGRRITLRTMPAVWPAPRTKPGNLSAWTRDRGGPAASVLHIACLVAGLDDVSLLADAAGVKRAFVAELLEEAVAARGGVAPDRFFAHSNDRDAFRASLHSEQILKAVARYCSGWRQNSPTPSQGIRAYVERVNAAVLGDDEDLLREAMASALNTFSDPWDYPAWCLDVVTKGGSMLAQSDPQPTSLLVDVVRFLRRAERSSDASQVATLTAVGGDDDDLGPGSWYLRAMLLCEQDKEGHARALLKQKLEALTPNDDVDRAHTFEAWAALADLRVAGNDVEGARQAWRESRRYVGDDDLYALARWHVSLAACAKTQGRTGCSVSHLRRASNLLLTQGDLVAAADVHERWGAQEVRRGKLHQGLDSLSRSAQLYRLLQDSEGEARARYVMGQTHARCASYDAAVDHLERAALVAKSSSLRELLVDIQLALALAHRGRGDLAKERNYAALAAEGATGAMARVRAAAILAEADLRAGSPGAEPLLERSERDLRAAGLLREANAAQLALFDSFLRSGDPRRAEAVLRSDVHAPMSRLAVARLALASGLEDRAREMFAEIGRDMKLPADVRAGAYAYLAEACWMSGRREEAREAAKAGSALLEVTHRSRADDPRIHRMLSIVFAHVGEVGRSVGHRSKARRRMRAMAAATIGNRERWRLMRTQWQPDPRPETVHAR